MASGLEGRRLGGLWLRDRGWLRPLAGRTVRDVAVRGKHLLVGLGPGADAGPDWVLHVHLGMRGRWHRYPHEHPWERPAHQASVRLDAERECWVCFRAARAELLRAVDLALHPTLSRLGPDLLGERVPLRRIVARARSREPRSVAELLLDQRVACGIGNVFKSEILFLEALHPRTSVAELGDDALARLYRRARRLLAANLGGWRRTTVREVKPGRAPRPGETRLWVYGRDGLPCLRCGTTVRIERLGDDARTTYWCPRCQKG